MNESKNPTEKIEYLTNQNKFYRLKLAQAAVKIQELKKELMKIDPQTKIDQLRKTGQL
jgi:LytS/YehU family sensor histidine kinase